MTSITPNSNPRPKSLLFSWLGVSVIFTISLITAIATMIFGMSQARTGKISLPWWYHTLMLLSQWGLALSALGLLALVIISIRRASKTQQ